MDIPAKTLSNGFSMPVFGFGTWRMGGGSERDMDNDDARDIAAIRHAIEHGITHLDTAEMYADGHAETLLGEAMQGFDRSKLFAVSKVSPWNLAYDAVLASAEASLKRLGTDYLDLYLVHKPNPAIPIDETMRAMNRLKDEGMIKHVGISNFNVEQAQEAMNHAQIAANQLHYNVQVREIEHRGVLAFCQQNGVMVIAWRPIGKIPDRTSAPVIQELCDKYGKTSAQIAINWLISQPGVVTLTKTSHTEHFDENLGAIGWTMDAEDVERLRTEFPQQMKVSDAVPLM